MRVLLADDHRLVRAGVRALLDQLPGVSEVIEVENGQAALTALRDAPDEDVPDVALLDIAMPGLGGLAVLREVGATRAARVLLLSMYDNDEYVFEALRCGAAGYLVKDSAVEELGMALAAVERGDKYFSPRVSNKMASALAGGRAGAGPALTPRQTEVLRLVARGLSSKEIARELALSLKTVETHRAQIMERLGIHELAGLVRYAMRVGLVDDGA
jgi:DNA-binding NarL/FixJ family response regulator